MRKSVAVVIASLAAGVAATRVHGRPTAHAVTAPFGQLPVMDYNTCVPVRCGSDREPGAPAGPVSGEQRAGGRRLRRGDLDDGWMATAPGRSRWPGSASARPRRPATTFWKNETTIFSGVSVALAAGQTETLVIKPTDS
jgi:hypothetical protein